MRPARPSSCIATRSCLVHRSNRAKCQSASALALRRAASAEQKRLVLSRLDELVVKPVDGYGGLGVVVGPRATDEELAHARALIEEQPSRWIAQETIALSTHPTLQEGLLEPRHVDLRVFVHYGKEPVVVPAALTRVAAAGSLVVNSSRGGGAKDTLLLR